MTVKETGLCYSWPPLGLVTKLFFFSSKLASVHKSWLIFRLYCELLLCCTRWWHTSKIWLAKDSTMQSSSQSRITDSVCCMLSLQYTSQQSSVPGLASLLVRRPLLIEQTPLKRTVLQIRCFQVKDRTRKGMSEVYWLNYLEFSQYFIYQVAMQAILTIPCWLQSRVEIRRTFLSIRSVKVTGKSNLAEHEGK